jgi:hypothetical protein
MAGLGPAIYVLSCEMPKNRMAGTSPAATRFTCSAKVAQKTWMAGLIPAMTP